MARLSCTRRRGRARRGRSTRRAAKAPSRSRCRTSTPTSRRSRQRASLRSSVDRAHHAATRGPGRWRARRCPAAPARDVLEDVQDADWLPDGSDLAVSHVVDGKYRLEFPIGKVVYETTGWVSHVRVSPDGKRVAFLDQPIVGDDRGSLSIIDGSGKKQSIPVECESTQGIAWAPSGNEVWFTCASKASGARCSPRRWTAACGRCCACRAACFSATSARTERCCCRTTMHGAASWPRARRDEGARPVLARLDAADRALR